MTGINDTQIHFNDWESSGEAEMLSDFRISPAVLEGSKVLVAAYVYEDYSGDAYVLFEKDGKLFEVHGGHCSCYGLEDQWEPEEVEPAAIRHRLSGAWGVENTVAKHTTAALDRFEAKR